MVWDLNHGFHCVSSINTSKEFLLRYHEPLAEWSFNNSSVLIFWHFGLFPVHSGINIFGLVSVIVIFFCTGPFFSSFYKLLLFP